MAGETLIRSAVIMAGGMGQRLQSVTKGEIPKCMVEVGGKPILERQIGQLAKNGVRRIVIVVGNLKERIKDHFRDGGGSGVSIEYVEEEKPLGTAGSLFFVKGILDEDFFLVFADTIFSIDLQRMASFHKQKGSAITLLAHPNAHPFDSDIIECDRDGKVTALYKKTQERPSPLRNLANASLFVVSKRALDSISEPVPADMERDVVRRRLAFADVFAYKTSEYIKDAGTPQRLLDVESDIKSGAVERRNLQNRQRCVFLDRDGTINKLNGFIRKPEDFELAAGAGEAVRIINESGALAIVITNQPVLARGECDERTLDSIHAKMDEQLARCGAFLDGLYYCPHHPDSGFSGEVKSLKVKCDCRKPEIGLFLKAQNDFNISFSSSFMIGDGMSDVIAGKRLGLFTCLIGNESGDVDANGAKYGEFEESLRTPDMRAASLLQAVKAISPRFLGEVG